MLATVAALVSIFQLEPKERQALKLAEIREALVSAGYDTTAKQAAVLRPKHGLVVAQPRQESWMRRAQPVKANEIFSREKTEVGEQVRSTIDFPCLR